jgi:hypothetical protein
MPRRSDVNPCILGVHYEANNERRVWAITLRPSVRDLTSAAWRVFIKFGIGVLNKKLLSEHECCENGVSADGTLPEGLNARVSLVATFLDGFGWNSLQEVST